MASRFDSSSSGSSEDEEEAPQLDSMTSSEDEVFEDAFDDVYDDLDAGELEVRAMRRRASEQMTTDFPLASKTETKTHRFLHPLSLSPAFSSRRTPMMTTRHQRCCETAWIRR
jgi:hypothetical protein